MPIPQYLPTTYFQASLNFLMKVDLVFVRVIVFAFAPVLFLTYDPFLWLENPLRLKNMILAALVLFWSTCPSKFQSASLSWSSF